MNEHWALQNEHFFRKNSSHNFMYLLLTFIVQYFQLNLRMYPDWHIFPKLFFFSPTIILSWTFWPLLACKIFKIIIEQIQSYKESSFSRMNWAELGHLPRIYFFLKNQQHMMYIQYLFLSMSKIKKGRQYLPRNQKAITQKRVFLENSTYMSFFCLFYPIMLQK